ncbi:MAG: hypothetical protein AVDCRST_MAG85-1015 [uncultured Solirubrobacteraceae bacterium]|uniref:Uncharacterized protein n=1 Tax=uncultured Solirubrobacteraceae bacterium TaxID=1162706 RepID=A0A6J4SA45_9ACTN|nr:MAG: hypothetical protein AVDCRST_MAG85-1015 [uncultured Solirubrobacteraceae bacterium]
MTASKRAWHDVLSIGLPYQSSAVSMRLPIVAASLAGFANTCARCSPPGAPQTLA